MTLQTLHLRATGCYLPYGITRHPTQVNTLRVNLSHMQTGWIDEQFE